MKRVFKISTIWVLALGVSLPATLPPDVEATLDRFLNTITAYDNFKMEFQLSAQLAGVRASAEGILLYDKSGKFKIEIGQLFYLLNDGQNLWFYTPLTKEYSRSDLPLQQVAKLFAPTMPSPTLGPALSYLLKQILLSENFALESASLREESLEGKKSLTLIFTSSKGFEVKIWLEPKSYELQQIGVMTGISDGQKLLVYLKVQKFTTNISLPPKAFVFTPPPGAKAK
ncbi:MAG: LolA family protein [bacterium]